MRNTFAKFLTNKAEKDKNIRLIVGDIGFRIFDEFLEKHPEQFLNAGIAEQNMISMASGMASEGEKTFIYTIIPFLVMRAYEQIRVDIGINKQSCILVGVGGGLAYDKLGPTHHSYEDIALMRSIPGMEVYMPFDPPSTYDCLEVAYKKISKEPSYVRLSKGGEPIIPVLKKLFENIYLIHESNPRKLIITHGAISNKITELVRKNNLNCNIYAITSMNKNVHENLKELIIGFTNCEKIIFIEECFELGSFYQTFIAFFKDHLKNIKIGNIHLKDKYIFDIYSRDELLEKNGFNLKNIKQFLD